MKFYIKAFSVLLAAFSLQACGPGFSNVDTQSSKDFADVDPLASSQFSAEPDSQSIAEAEAEVRELFQNHLNRAPSSFEEAYYVNELVAGNAIEPEIVAKAIAEQPPAQVSPAPIVGQPDPPSSSSPTYNEPPEQNEVAGVMYAISVRYSDGDGEGRKKSVGTNGGSPISRSKAERECDQLIVNGGSHRAGYGNYADPDFPHRADYYICVHAGEVIKYKGRVLRSLHSQSVASLNSTLQAELCERESHYSCN